MAMKRVMLVVCVVLMTRESDSRVWTPVGSPLISTYPCKNTNDIAVWFEPGVPSKDNNRYYVKVDKTIPAHSVIQVSFDAEVNVTITVRSDDNNYSRILLTDGDSFTLRFPDQLAGLSFVVKGTRPGVNAYLKGFTVDNKEYCDSPNVEFLDKYAETFPKDGKYKWSAKNTALRCGRRKVDHQEATVDGPAQPGDWPWHVAVYRVLVEDTQQEPKLRYLCGGTLISENYVLTGKEKQSVESIAVDKDFSHGNLNNDIALLKLKSAVQLTAHIQPACLWHRSAAADRPPDDDITGTLVGWGYTNDENTLSQTLQQVNLPMVSADTCIRSHIAFARLLNSNEFCAGYHNNGTSPCSGDSGGGFLVFIPDKKQGGSGSVSGAWYVRGVLSKGLKSEYDSQCNVDEYVIFTDVAKHRGWLDSHLDDNDLERKLEIGIFKYHR